MAVIYNATVRTNRMQQVLDAIDADASPGFIEIGDSGFATVLATITLADQAGSVSGDTLTFTMPQSDEEADAGGTAAEARIKDGAGNVVVSGLTVTETDGGGDLELDNTSINAGQQVTIDSASLSHAT